VEGRRGAALPCPPEGGHIAHALNRQVWSGWREQVEESPAERRNFLKDIQLYV